MLNLSLFTTLSSFYYRTFLNFYKAKHTDKKENLIFLIYNEIQCGAVAVAKS
jgi:hypothetical protein